MTPTLSKRLRQETREEHRRAERTTFARHLVAGDASVEDFLLLFRALQPVYVELEGALERHRAHPVVRRVRFAELYRSAALEKDLSLLEALAGDSDGRGRDASDAYVARIRSIAEHEPARLVAHAYVRYMGDLSGGQLIGRRLREAIGAVRASGAVDAAGPSSHPVAGEPGVPAFAAFEVQGGVDAAKARFREGLDALAATGCVDVEGIVDEAREAFALNRSLFVGLDRVAPTRGPS